MFNVSDDIQSLTDFKRDTAMFMRRIKKNGRPIVLTVNGKAALIVQDPVSYQKLLEAADRLDAIKSIKEGIAQADRGEGISIEQFDRRMRKKYGISS